MVRHLYAPIISIALLAVQNSSALAQDAEVKQTADASQEQGKQAPPQEDPAQILRPSETASTPSTGKRILANFWSDQKSMWSSPFHMKPEDRKWWGLFGGATAALIATDQRTSNALPNTSSQIAWSKRASTIGADYTTLPMTGAFYLYGRWKGDAKARETGVLGAEALLDSYMIVGVLKLAAGRERPEFGDGQGRFFKGEHGFPSGHAIMSWSFASLVAHEYSPSKITPIVAYSLATIVSASRFSARKHFASDIVAGGSMGWFIGKYVFEHHLDPNIHKRYDPTIVSRLMPSEIRPMFAPTTHSYGVSLAW
jgi:membrane-associated phospholipid phosphatase